MSAFHGRHGFLDYASLPNNAQLSLLQVWVMPARIDPCHKVESGIQHGLRRASVFLRGGATHDDVPSHTTEPDIPSRVAGSMSVLGRFSGPKLGSSPMLPLFHMGAGALAIGPTEKPTTNASC